MANKKQTPKGCLIFTIIMGIGFLVILVVILTSSPEENLYSEIRVLNIKEGQVYTGAGNEFQIDKISPIYEGQRIYVLEEKNNWLRFSILPEDTTWSGYVLKENTLEKSRWEVNKLTTEINNIQSELGVRLFENVTVSDNKATIQVANIWHTRNKQIRLQDAQTLWEIWANINNPKTIDNARIELVDLNNNIVGGSSSLAGSVIQVND